VLAWGAIETEIVDLASYVSPDEGWAASIELEGLRGIKNKLKELRRIIRDSFGEDVAEHFGMISAELFKLVDFRHQLAHRRWSLVLLESPINEHTIIVFENYYKSERFEFFHDTASLRALKSETMRRMEPLSSLMLDLMASALPKSDYRPGQWVFPSFKLKPSE
jgi:hypothetical protein